MTIQRPRGTRDFLPEDTWRRGQVRKAMQDVIERWGYQEVATPTFEHLELFTIKSGESVTEEIYSFQDKGGRDIALRPELTAPVMRMYVSELQNAPNPNGSTITVAVLGMNALSEGGSGSSGSLGQS